MAENAARLGVTVPAAAVCPGHSAPLDFLADWLLDRPPLSVVLGPRGGGKSYLAALATHLESYARDWHSTAVLGGSLAQSAQVYHALGEFDRSRPGWLASYTRTQAVYAGGATVSILAASPTSVRGPHVATLRLDEVDEIDEDIRESAYGMCMERHGAAASVTLTSTWHRVGGPMAALMGQAREGAFPAYEFCAFEVLERCPDSRSGKRLEKCPDCPIVRWCHEGKDDHPSGLPKAKRSAGHYAIESLAQKARAVSLRVFEADYLCRGPRADGVWFPSFSRSTHVGEDAEYDPALPAYLAVDCGMSRYTGAVFFQVRGLPDGSHRCTAFADYLGVDVVGEANARALLEAARRRCLGRVDRVRLDPASRQRNSIGPVVYGEYERVFGARLVAGWPLRSVRESLELLDSFVRPAAGPPALRVHPRCADLVNALESYRRAKRGGTFRDEPEEPQHPHEDLVDALRGGLCDVFPEGRRPEPALRRVAAGRVF